MTIDFHAPRNRLSYAAREADPGWSEAVLAIVDPAGRRVVDLGCGGGIYTRAFAALGAGRVIGVDFSQPMLETATERSAGIRAVGFHLGDAESTGLPDGCADVVFARALVHHLADPRPCAAEAFRLLAPGGIVIWQDRTAAQVRLPASPRHLRGWLFELFPRLLEIEDARRHDTGTVLAALGAAGFEGSRAVELWETRRRYARFDELAEDVRGRTGRSILHALGDDEIERLVDYLAERLPRDAPIVEQDPWMLWHAVRAA